MSTEQKINILQTGEYLTIFDVLEKILVDKHPEIVKQSAVGYIPQAHGQTAVEEVKVLPRERVTWDLDDGERGFYGQGGYQKAIGAQVEIGSPDFDPTLASPGAGRWFNDGETLTIDPHHEKSFVFVDLESKPSNETLGLFIKALKNWGTDWYILDTGNGSHLIIDHLTPSKDLPKYHGQIIMDMAFHLPRPQSIFFAYIGKYLIDNCSDEVLIRKWAQEKLLTFGHIEDNLQETGKYVFPIDLRYLGHIYLHFAPNNPDPHIDEGYLRVSSKHGSVPILKALQVDRQITVFEYKNDPFNRKQLSLPML